MAYGSSSYGSESYGGSLNVTPVTNSITFSLDAFLVYCTSPNGVTTIRYNFPFTLNAYLLKINNNTFNLDAKLIRFINFDINSYLQKTITSQLTLDAFIVYNISRCPGAVTTSDDITTGTIYRTDGIKNW